MNKIGDTYVCVRDYKLVYDDSVVFTKGKIYGTQFIHDDGDLLFVDDEGYDHTLSLYDVQKYFTKVSHEVNSI